jgi:hypothetical protein
MAVRTCGSVLRITDFYNHPVPTRFELTAARTAPPNQRERWEAIARRISDEDLSLCSPAICNLEDSELMKARSGAFDGRPVLPGLRAQAPSPSRGGDTCVLGPNFLNH